MCSARRRSADRRRRRAAGFSILDALAAVAFMSASVLGLSAASISVTRNTKTSDSVSAGTALAVAKLEQLRSMPLGAPQLTTGFYTDPIGYMKADGTPFGPFLRTWAVSAKDTPRFGLKTVTVTVTWTDSRNHTTQVASYVRCSTIPCS